MIIKKIFPFLFIIFIFSSFNVQAQTRVSAIGDKVIESNSTQAYPENAKQNSNSPYPEKFNPLKEGNFPYKHPSLVTMAIILALLSLLPFLMMLMTSFAKISIVLALLRNALGTQQAPPNQVINGISIIMTLFIMFPTGLKMYEAAKPLLNDNAPSELVTVEASEYVIKVIDKAKEPFRDFLKRNTNSRAIYYFLNIAKKSVPIEFQPFVKGTDFIVLVPSFVLTQLKGAFEVGILIYIPFFVIDLVTSNILLAMGMMMLSPVTISLPLKIFLLVMLDGWTLLLHGLVETFK